MNHYATKKTLAQGMLDLALLTANVSQLKYLLDVGELHPYFHLLLPLIVVSICLQVCCCACCRLTSSLFKSALIRRTVPCTTNSITATYFLRLQTAQAIVCVILGLIFDLNNVEEHKAANIYNNICLIIIITVTVINIVISGFDLKTNALSMLFKT